MGNYRNELEGWRGGSYRYYKLYKPMPAGKLNEKERGMGVKNGGSDKKCAADIAVCCIERKCEVSLIHVILYMVLYM